MPQASTTCPCKAHEEDELKYSWAALLEDGVHAGLLLAAARASRACLSLPKHARHHT